MKQHLYAKRTKQVLLAASFAAGLGLSAAPAYAGAGLNPHADEILRSMSSFIAGTKSFSVDADIENEVVNMGGQKLQFNSRSSLLVDRPSRFHVSRKGRFADAVLYFDGAKLTIFGKNLNAYVQKDLKGTIDDAIHGVEASTGLSAPGADLILANPYATLSAGVVSSGYYGKAYVGGVETHHLAFRTAKVDLQLWVKAGAEPLPMKYVITSKWITGAPQYSVQLSNWNLKPQVTAQQFAFSPPQGSRKIAAIPVDEAGEITLSEENK